MSIGFKYNDPGCCGCGGSCPSITIVTRLGCFGLADFNTVYSEDDPEFPDPCLEVSGTFDVEHDGDTTHYPYPENTFPVPEPGDYVVTINQSLPYVDTITLTYHVAEDCDVTGGPDLILENHPDNMPIVGVCPEGRGIAFNNGRCGCSSGFSCLRTTADSFAMTFEGTQSEADAFVYTPHTITFRAPETIDYQRFAISSDCNPTAAKYYMSDLFELVISYDFVWYPGGDGVTGCAEIRRTETITSQCRYILRCLVNGFHITLHSGPRDHVYWELLGDGCGTPSSFHVEEPGGFFEDVKLNVVSCCPTMVLRSNLIRGWRFVLTET